MNQCKTKSIYRSSSSCCIIRAKVRCEMEKEYVLQQQVTILNSKPSTQFRLDALSRDGNEHRSYAKSVILTDKSILTVLERDMYIDRTFIERILDSLQEIMQEVNRQKMSLLLHVNCKNTVRFFENHTLNRLEERILRVVLRNQHGASFLSDVPLFKCQGESDSAVVKICNEALRNIALCANKHDDIIKGHITHCVLAPQAAAYLFHEIVGHLFEYDYLSSGQCIFNMNHLGADLFPKCITVIDDFEVMEDYGVCFGQYDDRGQPLKKTIVVQNGKVCNAIKTRRVDTIQNNPLYRMYNLFLKENNNGLTQSEMIQKIDSGILIRNATAGSVNPLTGQFSLNASNCAFIKNGKLLCEISDFVISTDLQKVIESIEQVGKDISFFPSQCSKKGQIITVGTGAPSVLLSATSVLEDGLWT